MIANILYQLYDPSQIPIGFLSEHLSVIILEVKSSPSKCTFMGMLKECSHKIKVLLSLYFILIQFPKYYDESQDSAECQ